MKATPHSHPADVSFDGGDLDCGNGLGLFEVAASVDRRLEGHTCQVDVLLQQAGQAGPQRQDRLPDAS